MIRTLWLLAFSLTTAGIVSAQDGGVTRWRPKLHIFLDAGLKIMPLQETYSTEESCYIAGEKRAMIYINKNIPCPVYCEPIHQILNTGGFFT